MTSRRFVGIMAALVIGLTASAVFAEPVTGTQQRAWLRTTAPKKTNAVARSTTLSPGKWVAAAILLGLGGVALWKRSGGSFRKPIAKVSTMQIRAVTRLSAKAQLVAVEVQGRTLLLGATDTTVTRIGWLDDPTEYERESDDDEDHDVQSPIRLTETRTSTPSGASERNSATPDKNPQNHHAPLRKASRFREILADAIGFVPRRGSPNEPEFVVPVDELAAATEDRYVGRNVQQIVTQRTRREATSTTALIDIEGQAKGLVARLNRPST